MKRVGVLPLGTFMTGAGLMALYNQIPLWPAVLADLGALVLFVALHGGIDLLEKWHKGGSRRRFEAWRKSLDK
jgi:hypothetical protein